MKNSIILIAFCLISAKSFSQVEYSFEYKSFPFQGTDQYRDPTVYNGGNLSSQNILDKYGPQGWHLIQAGSGANLVLERATRTDSKTITDAINSAKAEMEARIDSIAAQKAADATAALKMELINAMKDAKLYDDEYKKSIIDMATTQFQSQLSAAIDSLKKQLSQK